MHISLIQYFFFFESKILTRRIYNLDEILGIKAVLAVRCENHITQPQDDVRVKYKRWAFSAFVWNSAHNKILIELLTKMTAFLGKRQTYSLFFKK